MKHLLRLPVAVLLVLQVSGCAFIYSLDKDINSKIDGMVDQNQYTRALKTISYIGSSHPQYELLQRRKGTIEQKARAYEQRLLQDIKNNIQQQQWAQAQQLLEEGLENLPDSEALQISQQDFHKKRQAYITGLKYQTYINKAEWLIRDRDVRKNLANANPDDKTASRELRQHDRDTEQVYTHLVQCGVESMNDGDLELAEKCFLLADKLQPDKGLQTTIQDIQNRLVRKKKIPVNILSEQGLTLLNQAKQQLQQGELKKAMTTYRQISVKDRKHDLVINYKRQLDSRIDDNVKENIELGRRLYSQGEIKQALAIWYGVRELDPGNEYLKSHIERAERVIDKLNRLQGGEKTITPPNVESKK